MAGTDSSRESVTGGPAIVLVEPQLGENIGTAARAMLNCGLIDLRLVRPRDGWPSQKAASASAGAEVVIDGARLYQTTADAVADAQHVFATTARPRGMVKPVMTPRAAAAEIRRLMARGERCAVLFGRERSGLANHDIMLAHTIVTVPLNPAYSSLNLAQGVLLIGYEWFQASDATPGETLPPGHSRPATSAEVQGFLDHLDRELDEVGFFKEANLRVAMERNLHNIFLRARLTEQEVRTLRGVVARLVGRRSGG